MRRLCDLRNGSCTLAALVSGQARGLLVIPFQPVQATSSERAPSFGADNVGAKPIAGSAFYFDDSNLYALPAAFPAAACLSPSLEYLLSVECRPLNSEPTRAMSNFDRPRRPFDRRNQDNREVRVPRFNRPVRQHQASPPVKEVVCGRVKWFSAEKGFGFVSLEDNTDVFLHGSVLARSGISVNPDDVVRVGVGQGLKGRLVTEVLEVKAAAAPAGHAASQPAPRPKPEFGPGPGRVATDSIRGVVKWWNQQKGFGFITPEAGTRDIFVHASTATRSGVRLEQRMPVRVKVSQGAKGPEAIEVASA